MAKILVTEVQLQRLSRKILTEQVNNPVEIAEKLQNEINAVLAGKADESIFDTMVHLKYDPKGNNMLLVFPDGTSLRLIGDDKGTFTKEIVYEVTDYPNPEGPQYAPITDVVTPIHSIQPNYDMTKIFEQVVASSETLGGFFEVDNEVTQFLKNQVVNSKPSFNWLPTQGGVKLIVEPTYEAKKPKKRPQNSTTFNDENRTTKFPLAAFTEKMNMPLWYNYRVGESLEPISDLYVGTVTMMGSASQELAQIEITIPTELLDGRGGTPPPNKPKVCECKDVNTGEVVEYPCGDSLPPECQEDIIIPVFSVMGDSLPYADNMVMPYFNKYPKAKEQFGIVLNAFVKYISAGGGDKLTNVTIKGSADSARPTIDVPSGYGGKLDHPGSPPPYGGITGNKERNQYLADNRSQQYANALIKAIKDRTGFDLKIKVLPGDNYYGQEGKRGQEFRKITLSPNAPKHKGTPKKK